MLPGTLGPEEIANVLGVQNWLRRQFAANARYDRLVADLIVATGGGEQGPALFYTVNELKPEKIAGATARIFLGLQLECAQCHDHPFDRWTQRDFWGYAAFFGQLDRAEGRFRAVRLTDDVKREVTLPDSEEVIAPKYPGGEKASVGAGGSRRVQLAIWMSNRENPYLAKAAVNLLWAQMFGRGLVNPIDDIGPHNAPSHPEVFDALADYFVQSGYDVKELLRTIASTETYQRSSRGKLLNVESESWYARRSVKPLSADQFFASLQRLQDRSIEQPSRIAQFLQPEKQAFLAKLRRQSRDPIEFDAGVPQALTLMNGRQIQRATDPQQSGVIGALQAPWLSDQQRIELVFLSTVSRLPTAEESDICIKMVRKGKSQDVLGDILWSLINSAEFAFNY